MYLKAILYYYHTSLVLQFILYTQYHPHPPLFWEIFILHCVSTCRTILQDVHVIPWEPGCSWNLWLTMQSKKRLSIVIPIESEDAKKSNPCIWYSAKRRRGTAACQLWLPDQALGLISVDIRLSPHRYCICNISSSTVEIVRE